MYKLIYMSFVIVHQLSSS